MHYLILINFLFVLLSLGQGDAAAATTNIANDKKYEIFNNIPDCSQKDGQLGECLKRVYDVVLPRIKDGNKELNLPPFDPFALNRTTYEYENGAIKARITIKDALIYGLAEGKLKDLDFKINGDKIKYHAKGYLPKLNVIGKYKADAVFNTARLKPRGTFNLTMTDISVDEFVEGELYDKDGHRFVHFNKIDVEPVVNGFNLNATGLFEDPDLNELVLSLANQSWREIYSIMLPETKKYWAPMLLQVINEASKLVPFDLFIKSK